MIFSIRKVRSASVLNCFELVAMRKEKFIILPLALQHVVWICTICPYVFCLKPETVLNFYKILPNFKFKSIEVKEQLDNNHILSDYLHHWKPPGELNIEFFELYSKRVKYGNYISPLDCLEPPGVVEYVSFFPISRSFEKELYTLVLNGIDQEGFETCHAIWINIHFNNEAYETLEHDDGKKSFRLKLDLFGGKELMKYYGPRPLQGTGTHQYVFILFRQPHGLLLPQQLKFRENWGSNHLLHHGVASWADYYELKPIGVNFFTSSNEDLF